MDEQPHVEDIVKVREYQCQHSGCSYDILMADAGPQALICSNCGRTWRVRAPLQPLHDLDTSIQIFGGVIYHATMRASGNNEKLSAALTMESAEAIMDRFRERPDLVEEFVKVLDE